MSRPPELSRRDLLHSAAGLGLAPLLGARSGTHHTPRAKRVIYLHMVGAPSHLCLLYTSDAADE